MPRLYLVRHGRPEATFSPDHCSVTVIDVADGTLRLVELGAEAATRVL